MKLKIFFISIFLLFSINSVSLANYVKNDNTINILFTHDMHDHIEGYNIQKDENLINIGGYERLNNKIQEYLKKDKDSLVLDAGDYSMGTLFQTIYQAENPSLRLMGKMGYHATTIGNHEFDYRTKGLTESLYAAKNSNDKLPEILVSNIDFKNYENVNKKDVNDLKKSFDNYGVKEYKVFNKKGYKIGIFGLMGYESISNSPMAGVNFEDPIDSAKRIVKKLKEKEKVDLIICLSHSGTWDDKSKSEDELMAKEVKDIDLIISGHTHTTLNKPIIIGKTIIASSGSYSENLGIIELKNDSTKWNVENYSIYPLTNNVDEEVLKPKINYFKEKVQKEYLDNFNLKFNQILANSKYNFTPINILENEHREDALPNLITDSYIEAVKNIEGENYEKITAAIVPNGTIRSTINKGEISVSDIFNISSLGIGPDEIPGYPLISVYLTGKELKTAAEVDASIQPMMSVAQLYFSGANYTFNPNRLIFNKVTDFYILDENGERTEVNDNELYRVVTGLYTAQMLSIVKDESFGLMSIVPKDSSGNEIKNFEKHIIYDGEKELKEWYALAKYIESFEKENGISQIPEKYSKLENRKVVNNDNSISAILSKPNNIAKTLYSIIIIVLILLVLIVRIFLKKLKNSKIKKA
ncbi:bifunctional metallophosphatase/5'-nucleotidase [Miniphocaeibacter massiliensis]|uniref:bifunctional metallophosphatase/5'-nucleotidase n=1 Tax=Miniphocaeibacter massiliensis TaxID=2041841 RepID=UPI000C1C6436|nr:bifunctional UDP-sugar hydrolase/5'-nucleotidase [Miniphocaeibacter massiliensis]